MIRVLKVGGSLLSVPDLVSKLERWIGRQSPATNVLIIGGGPWVEAIRGAQPHLKISDESAHWLAIKAMSLTASLVASASEAARSNAYRMVNAVEQIPNCDTAILDAGEMLRTHPQALPRSWQSTSDSIAAWVARQCRAEELVLLKSRAARRDDPDLVDEHFSRLASDLSTVRIVDFRTSYC